MHKLDRNFYKSDAILLSKDLLGKCIARKINGELLIGRIVEVEAYKGLIDKAAHSYGGKITERTKIMYGEAGYAYVYMIYGMYYCLNVVASEVNVPEAILIRAVEPLQGMETMSMFRYNKHYDELKKREKINLTSGPGKLCKAFNITKKENGYDLCSEDFYIFTPESSDNFNIKESKRINIDYAEEAKDFLWRFYIEGNPYVSK